MNKPNQKTGNRTVLDSRGTTYELTEKIGEGGQGVVCRTQYPNVLVKVSRHPASNPKTQAWHDHLRWVARQPLDGLHIARPLSMVIKPRLGYVMELMDGLMPLSAMLESAILDAQEGRQLSAYQSSGGVRRRVKLLAKLARTLAALHGRGLAFGDLSPNNVFVSQSVDHDEVWLIDADNICALSREGDQRIYTRDFGAPEILRGETGVNSLTDVWSFAVLAFQLLTLAHPLKGDLVVDGEPEQEEAALMGALPWIDHPTDHRNQSSYALAREDILTLRLRETFEQCFNAGLNSPGARPTMAEWAEAMEAATMLLADCEGCGCSFLFNPRGECPFCGLRQDAERLVMMRHFVFAPLSDLGEGAQPSDQWIRTDYRQLITQGASIVLRSSPVGSSTYADSAAVCGLELSVEGLTITPMSSLPITLLRAGGGKELRVRAKTALKAAWKKGTIAELHIGDITAPHAAWRFQW